MAWELFRDEAWEEWLQRSNPSVEDRVAVLDRLFDLATNPRWLDSVVRYPGQTGNGERYESGVPGSRVWIEFIVFQDLGILEVIRIEPSSLAGR